MPVHLPEEILVIFPWGPSHSNLGYRLGPYAHQHVELNSDFCDGGGLGAPHEADCTAQTFLWVHLGHHTRPSAF